MIVAAQSPPAAPHCSFPPWSVPISTAPLQAGHPFPARKPPIFILTFPPRQKNADPRHSGQAEVLPEHV